MDENFLMSIASLGAMFLGDYSEAVGVMLFCRVGEYLQERAVGSSHRSVNELMNLRPEFVHVKEGGEIRDVPPAEVRRGTLIEVRPGERVPLDSVVTRDSSSAGAEVGRRLDLDEVFSGLMPADKLEHVRRLKPETGLLAFVGDGMNDAPSLAAADIGIAMGGVGSDTALQAADMVVMKGEPVAVPQGILLSRATERIIVQNIVLILGVKLLVMVLGILGLAGMWGAVMADVGVCLLAVGNPMRIFRVRLGV